MSGRPFYPLCVVVREPWISFATFAWCKAMEFCSPFIQCTALPSDKCNFSFVRDNREKTSISIGRFQPNALSSLQYSRWMRVNITLFAADYTPSHLILVAVSATLVCALHCRKRGLAFVHRTLTPIKWIIQWDRNATATITALIEPLRDVIPGHHW